MRSWSRRRCRFPRFLWRRTNSALVLREVQRRGALQVGFGQRGRAALVAADASALYARNLFTFLGVILDAKSGEMKIDRADEIIAACLMAEGGQVVKKG